MEWDETGRVHDGFMAWEWFGSLPGTKRALYQLHYGRWSLLSRALTVGEDVGAPSPVQQAARRFWVKKRCTGHLTRQKVDQGLLPLISIFDPSPILSTM